MLLQINSLDTFINHSANLLKDFEWKIQIC